APAPVRPSHGPPSGPTRVEGTGPGGYGATTGQPGREATIEPGRLPLRPGINPFDPGRTPPPSTSVDTGVSPRLVPDDGGRRSHTLHKTLRSGAVIRYDGDLYVFGDVNPGAQVVATGNIIVLGALKGVAHAGAGGDEAAFILAFDLRPTQLRIGRRIAVPPGRKPGAAPPAAFGAAELATVRDGQIAVEPYKGRVPRS
ncbi:MAG: septum site-determining protein MinC, partial [Myxococcota bacterium]